MEREKSRQQCQFQSPPTLATRSVTCTRYLNRVEPAFPRHNC